MKTHFKIRRVGFVTCESGATLVEYGVALLVAIVVAGVALTQLAGEIDDSMSTAECQFQSNTSC